MAVLLPHDQVEVWRSAGDTDEHGWVTDEGAALVATYIGSVQEEKGLAGSWDPNAVEAGGAGPYRPYSSRRGSAYLDPSADVLPGDVVVCRGVNWSVTDVMYSLDPRQDSNALDCLECVLVSKGVR